MTQTNVSEHPTTHTHAFQRRITESNFACFFRTGICAEAGVTCDEWVENEYYQDEQTVAIVAAGAKALGVSVGNLDSSCAATCFKPKCLLDLYHPYFLNTLKSFLD